MAIPSSYTQRIEGGVSSQVERYEIASKIAESYVEKLEDAKTVATGELRASVRRWRFVPDNWTSEKGSLKMVFNLPLYWRAIEEGRKPTTRSEGGALLPAIKRWINEKPIIPIAGENGKIPTTDQLAFAITKKIHKEGFYSPGHQGKHCLEKAMKDCEDRGLFEKLAHSCLDQYGQEIHVEFCGVYSK